MLNQEEFIKFIEQDGKAKEDLYKMELKEIDYQSILIIVFEFLQQNIDICQKINPKIQALNYDRLQYFSKKDYPENLFQEMKFLDTYFNIELIERKENYTIMVNYNSSINLLKRIFKFLDQNQFKKQTIMKDQQNQIKTQKIQSNDKTIDEIRNEAFLESRKLRGLKPPKKGTLMQIGGNYNQKKQKIQVKIKSPVKNSNTLQNLRKQQRIEQQKTLGMECFKLTNDFLQQKGRNKLDWSPILFDIALVHSKNMALKKVPFGHQGFSKRSKEIMKYYTQARENVAYSTAYDNVCKTVVQGWINSPGHLKNIMSKNYVSAVAGYYCEDYNLWYFTQLFAQ